MFKMSTNICYNNTVMFSPKEQFDNFTFAKWVDYMSSHFFSSYFSDITQSIFGVIFNYIVVFFFLLSIFIIIKIIALDLRKVTGNTVQFFFNNSTFILGLITLFVFYSIGLFNFFNFFLFKSFIDLDYLGYLFYFEVGEFLDLSDICCYRKSWDMPDDILSNNTQNPWENVSPLTTPEEWRSILENAEMMASGNTSGSSNGLDGGSISFFTDVFVEKIVLNFYVFFRNMTWFDIAQDKDFFVNLTCYIFNCDKVKSLYFIEYLINNRINFASELNYDALLSFIDIVYPIEKERILKILPKIIPYII